MTGKTDQTAPLISCSVVVRALNEAQHLGRLLAGIQQQTVQNLEVILVDSGSKDDTCAIACDFGARVINLAAQEFTFGRSLNRGMEAAQGEIVVNISAHCYPVYPDWLERLLGPFSDPQVAISYGKQRGGPSNHYSEHQIFNKYFPDTSQPRQATPFTHNGNAAIRRSLWEALHYNENITGLEDIAWSSWIQSQGYGIAYVAEAEVVHIHHETPRQVFNRYRREAIGLKQILPKSGFSLRNFLGLWLRSTASDLNQARRESVFQREWWGILWFRFLQYLGTWQGYRQSEGMYAGLPHAFYYPPGILDSKPPIPRAVKPIDYSRIHSERKGIE